MSLLSKAGLLARIRRNKESRARLVASNLDKGIAFQIRATREKQTLTQAELAIAAGMGQNNISRLERSDYGKYTISSLKRIADALDVALVVRFVPFGQYIDWLSATPYLDEGLRPEALAVPSFEDEEKSGKHEAQIRYFALHLTLPVAASPNHSEVSGVYQSRFVAPVSIPAQESQVA
jgi:transcriptional regulator with XRE-family HTH domain